MTIVRRSAGIGVVALSAVGFLLCLAGAGGVWFAKSRLDPVVAFLFATADDGFEFVETGLGRAARITEQSRKRVAGLSTTAARLKALAIVAATELEPVSRTLDEIHRELKAAEQWLDSGRSAAARVGRAAEAIASTKFAAEHEESVGLAAAKVAEFSSQVGEALVRLEDMRGRLVELGEKRITAKEIAVMLLAFAVDLEGRLERVSAAIDRFTARTAAARTACAELGERVHWWIAFTAVMLTLLAAWFGLSQLAMARHGVRLIWARR